MSNQASKVTAVGLLALLGGALCFPACGSGGDDDDDDGAAAGSGGSGTAGTKADAGSSGTMTNASGASGADSGPITYGCPGVVPPTSAITDFTSLLPTSEPKWGAPEAKGAFYGGLFAYGGTAPAPTTDVSADDLHITGTIGDYSGAGLYIAYCADASKYKGVRFKISGNAGPSKKLTFFTQTNTNQYPDAKGMKGVCQALEENKFIDCVPPSVALDDIGDPRVVDVTWAELGAGLPASAATTSGKDLIGLQWAFPWAKDMKAYEVDVHIDDVAFIGDDDAAGMAGAGGAK